MARLSFASIALLLGASFASAAQPVFSYIFPAGGQRGTTVKLRVGGLFLHDRSYFELVTDRIESLQDLKPIPRIWFEGPILPLPESQQSEDYPVDRGASIAVPKDAPRGPLKARLWTSQGAASGPAFVVGDLPEVVEEETEGDPIPIAVTLPVTANGRIFPREDIDLWEFAAKKGESITAFAPTTAIRTPVAPWLEILDSAGKVLAEQSSGLGIGRQEDAALRFTAPADGTYRVRIRDAKQGGGPAHVYRLTITNGPVADVVFPLGGSRGSTVKLNVSGQAIPKPTVEIAIPADAPKLYPLPLPGTDALSFDVDDLPEHVGPTAADIAVPAALNGRVGQPGVPDQWRLILKKGTKYEFELLARSLGSRLCGGIVVRDPTGKELARGESPDPTTDPILAFVPPADGVYAIGVVERFRTRSGGDFRYRLKARIATATKPGFRLNLASDVAGVPRGSTAKLKVMAERLGGFDGPIELAANGLPPGVTATKAVIAAKQSSTELALSADAAAKVLPARVAIVGTSTVGKESATHEGQDHLFVVAAVPTPFRFTGEYTMGNAPRGQPYSRKYKLERAGFDGPITIQLANRQIRHLQGADGSPIFVPPGQTDFTYFARLPAWIETGRTCRVTLMAVGTVTDPDGTKHSVSFTSTEQNHQMIVVPEPGRLGVECLTDSYRVQPNSTARIPFRLSRAKGMTGAATVELVLPVHWRGVTSKFVTVSADTEMGELVVRFDKAPGPFNGPATVRATLGDAVAEAKVEFVPPR